MNDFLFYLCATGAAAFAFALIWGAAAGVGYTNGKRDGTAAGRLDGHAAGFHEGYATGRIAGISVATRPQPLPAATVIRTAHGAVVVEGRPDLDTLRAVSPGLFDGPEQ